MAIAVPGGAVFAKRPRLGRRSENVFDAENVESPRYSRDRSASRAARNPATRPQPLPVVTMIARASAGPARQLLNRLVN